MKVKKNSVILFQGDSVTDCGRDYNDINSVGESYVRFVKEALEKYNIKCINKGISGNKVNDLLDRFNRDFKEVNPDYIFILIGVNDTWHDFHNQKKNSDFESEYRTLLEKIKNEINVPVVLMEPFIMGDIEEYTKMRHDLLEKVEVIRKLAKEYKHEYIAFDSDFAEALSLGNFEEYTIEGIHPLYRGYLIMTDRILRKIEIID